MLDWFAVNRQLVSKLEVWILSNGIGALLLALLFRAGWMYFRFHSWPLSDLQMLLPAVAIGLLLLLNWTLKGSLGQFLGGLAALVVWLLAGCMLPWIIWPMADLPQWMVLAGLGFLVFAFVFTGIARAASRLRLRLHGRDWILKHLRHESFLRRLDAHRHLSGLGLIAG